MRVLRCVGPVLTAAILVQTSGAIAQSVGPQDPPKPVVKTGGSAITVKAKIRHPAAESGSGPGVNPTTETAAGPECHEYASTSICEDVAQIPGVPRVSAGMVLAAMRRTPLPASELIVEPPNGRTLVNFATNFYVVQPEFTRTMNLLGQQVQLQVWPEQFRWNFGDGESDVTSEPGAPYPDLEVTHDYLSKGVMRPSVDTTYAAQFRVGGGGWQPVNGTVTIPGASVPLQVVEATPKLVG